MFLGGAAASRIGFLTQCARAVSLLPSVWRHRTPQQVAFVEKLTKLVLRQLPNFWKLWISYVNGSLFSEVRTHVRLGRRRPEFLVLNILDSEVTVTP